MQTQYQSGTVVQALYLIDNIHTEWGSWDTTLHYTILLSCYLLYLAHYLLSLKTSFFFFFFNACFPLYNFLAAFLLSQPLLGCIKFGSFPVTLLKGERLFLKPHLL